MALVVLPSGLQLDAWRREADYWQKCVERSDDQAGGLLTACLTVGGLGTAAAGYVQKHADDALWMVQLGVGLVAFAGFVTLASRTMLGSGGRAYRGRHQSPSVSDTTASDFLEAEQRNAATRTRAARRREVAVGAALFIWAAGLIFIALAGRDALNNASESNPPQSATSMNAL